MNLENHVIKSVRQWQVRTRFPRFHGSNAKLPAHYYGIDDVSILEITTDKGISGFGLGKKDYQMVSSLLGKAVSEVFAPEIGILSDAFYNADIALHDLAGKILGISVKEMISKDCVKEVSCYDGSIYMNDISPQRAPGGIKAIIDNCRYDRDVIGFKDFKIKTGRGAKWMGFEDGLQRDIDVVCAVRENFPDARILIDANDAYDIETTIRFMEGVKDCNIYWLEECFEENEKDLKTLKEYLAKNSPETLVADGEWAPNYIHTRETVALVEDLAKKGLLDVLLMDTQLFGFTNWRKYMKKCADMNIMASPHNWNVMLKTLYCSHLAAAFPQVVPSIEGVGDTTEGICWDGYVIKDGMLTVPDTPGFGMEFIWGKGPF